MGDAASERVNHRDAPSRAVPYHRPVRPDGLLLALSAAAWAVACSTPAAPGPAPPASASAMPSAALPESSATPSPAATQTYTVEATVRAIETLSSAAGEIWLVEGDPRYVVRLDVHAVTPADGAQGAALQPSRPIAFGIHSPTRLLGLDAETGAGKRIRLEVTRAGTGDEARYTEIRRATP